MDEIKTVQQAKIQLNGTSYHVEKREKHNIVGIGEFNDDELIEFANLYAQAEAELLLIVDDLTDEKE